MSLILRLEKLIPPTGDCTKLKFFEGENVLEICPITISKYFEPRLLLGNYGVLGALFQSLDVVFDASVNKNSSYLFSLDRGQGINLDDEIIDRLKNFVENISIVRNLRRFFRTTFEFLFLRYISDIEYIYAHSVTQSVLYNSKDNNDYLSKTIHEFANKNISKRSSIHEFIVRWMKEFKIGIDYKVDSFGGEAHIVKVQNLDRTFVNLADKGMGSIQLMTLLFRIATKMKDLISLGSRCTTVIVEEPEQNLHPMLQSKLADLFYELYDKYRFNFIIETHSEYLIRKSQVLVSQLRTKRNRRADNSVSNPFKVYYFPSDGIPYDMDYASDGNFNEEFGTGFFDEASNLAFQVL